MFGRSMSKLKSARFFAILFSIAGVLLILSLLFLGREYYLLSRPERSWNSLHESLRPSGLFAHGLGILAVILMLINLLYLLRRRLAHIPSLGRMQSWLDLHVAMGILGIALILPHSALLFHNPIALSASLFSLLVLLTGAMGRWLYGLLPRGSEGEEQDGAEMILGRREALDMLDPELRLEVLSAERQLARWLPPPPQTPLETFWGISTDPWVILRLLRKRRALRLELQQRLEPSQISSILRYTDESLRLRKRVRRLAGLKALTGTWRGIHRISTFLLVLSVVAHIITMLSFGR